MGFFSNRYNKPGPGVGKNEPEKRRIVVFFEVYFRHFWQLEQTNLVFLLFMLPVFALLFGINLLLCKVTDNGLLINFFTFLPLALAMLLRPKHFPLWYVVQLVKGISVLAILLSLISLIGCKYGVIVENDDIMNAVRLWPKGRGVCLVLLCAGLLLSVGSICAARPVQRVGEYFGIAKK